MINPVIAGHDNNIWVLPALVLTVTALETVRLILLIREYNGVFYGYDEPYFACTQSASASDHHRNQVNVYWPRTW